MLNLLPERLDRILLLGAHCDDIAIGAGGTLLELCRAYPGVHVTALVLTGAGSLREEEERSALAAFTPGAELEVVVMDLPDGRVPLHWERAKMALEELRTRGEPDLILGPSPHDAHQDHRTLAQMIPTAYRDHLTLGYEILKWEGDLAQPTVYLPLAEPVLTEKVAKLSEHYGSQQDRPWFDDETFRGLARVRGVQCHARYAEAFHVQKLTLSVAPIAGSEPSPGFGAA
ncbi:MULTISPECIES: PIG-L deacetylase family protein [Pseudonocardia]|uniref:GlcNAc-PI de-N-acetylase n=2 Tax=Pseudonocardia TaxID=1847 RepID=A0A1Y2MR51_PSEAH|nr:MULTISPECIES: PIG-L deacetylase family protein [Pseudonocardia]OSY37704.1 GlcNAc-PI de-N-acetylase [Pseudonocardia autotrophica]TDN75806.1 LmbE family N-acetylglucosaminyl deacetylase [Pseudonocardia autotrophica]BBF99777.1 GlcNAc-PI de-N-acetylase [Pseudonocardia autotrophica]GEC27081.1 GlcNAc-PI de-N-acetylase [Pseudonocardia saturnea]